MPSERFNFASTCLFLVGPTASGKTAVVRALAKRLPIEVVNCDSMQVYRGLEILSQAPTAAERKAVKHHLVSFLPVEREYNVADFIRDARRLIASIHKRKRLPVVCGGTGLYFSSLMDGIFEGPGENPELRARLYKEADKAGPEVLHARLTGIDPAAAAKIHPRDTRRMVRAFEVIESTGELFSVLKSRRSGLAQEMDAKVFGLAWPREMLYARIDKRVRLMFKQGAVNEARKALKHKVSKTASGCIGLKEIGAHLDGKATLAETQDLMAMNTRRFAKRQLTWFRRDKRIHWIDMNTSTTAANAAAQIANPSLFGAEGRASG